MREPLACSEPVTAQQSYLYQQLVAELADFAVFLIDPDRCIVSWNPGVEKILGYPESEWLGHPLDFIFTQADRSGAVPIEQVQAAASDGRCSDMRWYVRRDGKPIFLEGTLLALRDGNDVTLGYAKVLRNLTERKLTEQRLKDALAYAMSITDTVREPLLILNGELRVHSANRAFYQTFRVAQKETEGQLLYDLGNGQWDIPSLRHLLEQILPRETTIDGYEVQHVFPGIGPKLMQLNARKLWREGNHTELILLAFEDISARRQAEVDLKASEQRQTVLADLGERLRDLKEIPQILHAAMELVGRILQVDGAGFAFVDGAGDRVTTQTSWASGELPSLDGEWSLSDFGERILSRLQSGAMIAVADTLNHPLTSGKEENWAAIHVRAHLEIPVLKNGRLVALFFLSHSQPRNWREEEILFFRKVGDRTWAAVEREQSNLDRERLTRELSRSNQELTRFAHIAAHDLQAPLRGVVSYSQLLQRQASSTLSEPHREFLDLIIGSAKRMQDLVHSLLRFAQVGQGEIDPQPVSMQDVLNATLIDLKPQISETCGEVVSGGLPTVVGSEVQLSQLLQNLVGNALKYSRPGIPPRVEISASEQNQEFVFEVRDNGEGIPPEHLASIFEPLKRLHGADVPGSGMGLATCSRIVERHGGRIWVESAEGVGSCFRFSLPK